MGRGRRSTRKEKNRAFASHDRLGSPSGSSKGFRNKGSRKGISFATSENKVSFVRVPPRTENSSYWFTETQRIVRKGIHFEVEPLVNTGVQVDCRLQLTSLACSTITGEKHAKHERSCVSLLSEDPIGLGFPFQLAQDKLSTGSSWLAIGSVSPGEIKSVKVILPPGPYQLRCEGPRPVQVFAQVWDVERELK